MRCQCLTKSGTQCTRNTIDGSQFCYQHQNCSNLITPSPKTPQSGEMVKLKPKINRDIPRLESHASPKPAPPQPRSHGKEVAKLLAMAPNSPMTQPQQPIQAREVTKARTIQQMAECQICGQYVQFRRLLRPYNEAPPHLLDRSHVIQVCQRCYNRCMEQCNRVYHDPVKCKQNVCGNEFLATSFAQVDQQRMAEEARHKMVGVVAIQSQLGKQSRSQYLWPQVPKHNP